MSRRLFSRPTKVSEFDADELYQELDKDGWRSKAKQLQQRRWKVVEEREQLGKLFRNHHTTRLRQLLS